jgi:hypothetical protein
MQNLSHHQNSFLNTTIMSCLYEFPSDLVVSILAHWCDIKSIVKTDSATCNTLERNLLMWSYQSDGFVVNNYFPSDLPFNLGSVHWIYSKQIKLSTLKFNEFRGISGVGEAVFKLNTNAITKISFSTFPILTQTIRKQFLSKMVQFINSCHQLSYMSFDDVQHNNQCIVELHPNILKQLQTLVWLSSRKLFQQKFTMPVLIEHCTSLTALFFSNVKITNVHNHVSEQMLINLIINNKKLQTIQIMYATVTDQLVDAIFNHCKLVKYFIVINEETHGESQISQRCLNNLFVRWLKTHPGFISINGTTFGLFPHSTHEFCFKGKVSTNVFHDLILLSQAPVLKNMHINDNLLYYENEFVLWCVDAVETRNIL